MDRQSNAMIIFANSKFGKDNFGTSYNSKYSHKIKGINKLTPTLLK